MKKVVLSNPNLLLILILLIVILIIPFIYVLKKRRCDFRIISSFALHLLIFVNIAFALSNVKLITTYEDSGTEIYLLADVSFSNQEKLTKLDETIKKIESELDDETKMGVACFGKDFEIISELGANFVSIQDNKVDGSATNIANALYSVQNLFSSDSTKRVIVLSDGKQTDGDCVVAAEELMNQNIHIDAINYNEGLSDKLEIQINDISYTPSTFINHHEEATIAVQSNFTDNVSLTLYKNDEIMATGILDVTEGLNIIRFALDTTNEGTYEYKINVSSTKGKDSNDKNNSLYFVQEVVSDLNVLAISNKEENNYPFFKEIYGDNAKLTCYDYQHPIPLDLESLCQFDEILLDNLKMDDIPNSEQFAFDLDAFASVYGKSIVTLGEVSSSNKDSIALKKVEDFLPIRFHPSNDSRVVVLIIDCSFSMAEEERLEKAKAGAKKCLDLLDKDDYIMIESFCQSVNIVHPISKLTNLEPIKKAIDSIELGPGTYIGSSLNTTYKQIQNLDYDSKQVILLSDGEPSETDTIDPLSVVKEMSNSGIFTSVINISSLAGAPLMNQLSVAGNGSYYYVENSDDLANIMTQEIQDEYIDAIIEGTAEVSIDQQNHDVMESVSYLPNVEGYYYSRVRGRAELIASTIYTNKVGGQRKCPIYATWNYGRGKVSSFTSNLYSKWASSWKKVESSRKFFKNFVDSMAPQERIDTSLNIAVENNGYTSTLSVGIISLKENATVKATILSPSGKKETKDLSLAKSLYVGTFDTEEVGVYHLQIRYGNEKDYIDVYKKFTFSYSSEYDGFDNRKEVLLYKIVSGEGEVYTTNDSIKKIEHKKKTQTTDITYVFVLISVVLFVLDVAVRKVSIRTRRKKHEPTN